MKSKADIVANWLPRYTGTPAKVFSKYVLLVNFTQYVHLFAEWHGVEVRGLNRPMPNATANGITILNFGMGQRQRRHRHGPAQRGASEGGAVSRQMRRLETEE